MKFNLHFAYWSLFFISLISSSLLFLIVASETIKSSDQNVYGKISNNAVENNVEQSTSSLINDNNKLENLNNKEQDIETTTTINSEDDSSMGGSNIEVQLENVLEINKNHINSDESSKTESSSSVSNIEKVPKIKKLKKIKKDIDKEQMEDIIHLQNDDVNRGNEAENVVINEEIQNMPANPAVITLGVDAPELIVDNNDIYENNILTESDDKILNKTGEHDDRIKTESTTSTTNTISNDFVILSEVNSIKSPDTILSHDISPEERSQQINDSGGGIVTTTSTIDNGQFLSSDEDNNIDSNDTIIKHDIPITSTTADVNLTIEEHPIPVFSEWAQKQMEEAEKQLEKDVVNSSTMKKNMTNGMGKPHMLKLRTKNYASPDCGAKIIASNIEAQNTGALLTTSKDEYMLSPCTNRIWFVVELCEAIQAKQIDLANFELFSSSPKNFTVAVSNRYPTRDWSNVGRFIAEDSRNIQSFELYPHLFGKYVRVDIHSHYSSEHFCPISLFRVYGTSEFEAFETENRNPYDDLDDDDIVVTGVGNNGDIDDIIGNDNDNLITNNDNNNIKKENQNLFKSASDAVMSIVKKAAQVLVKEKPNQTTDGVGVIQNHKIELCFTPKLPNFECSDCSQAFIINVNYLLSCKYNELIKLLNIDVIKNDILKSRICANRYNINIMDDVTTSSHLKLINHINEFNYNNDLSSKSVSMAFHEQNSFYLSMIALDYLAAMCHILNQSNLLLKEHQDQQNNEKEFTNNDSALNLTIDKKIGTDDDKNIDFIDDNVNIKNKIKSKDEIEMENDIQNIHNVPNVIDNSDLIQKTNEEIINLEINKESAAQIPMPALNTEEYETQQQQNIIDSKETISSSDGVNIFNLVVEDNKINEYDLEIEESKQIPSTIEDNIKFKDDAQLVEDTKENNVEEVGVPVTTTTAPTILATPHPTIKQKDSGDATEQPPSWDSIDKLLSEQMSSETISAGGGGNSNFGGSTASYQVQHKSGHHSESVFIRLSNRIKALERNMSLSGQYLEELSRRYKKQVEELQNSFAKTLNAIEEQNRRAAELEQFLVEQNYNLKENLEDLSQKFYFWISILLCIASVVLIHIIISWYSVSSIGRKQTKLLEKYEECSMVQNKTIQKKLHRRKSVEGVSGHPTPTHKIRRPSEQAMRISGSYKDLMIFEEDENYDDRNSNDIINGINGFNEILSNSNNNNEFFWSKSKFKPNMQISSSASTSPTEIEEIFPRQRKSSVFYNNDNQPFQLIQQFPSSNDNNKTKKLNRQESAPDHFTFKDENSSHNSSLQSSSAGGNGNLTNALQKCGIPEEILIVDDDYENYLPGTDLVYNEYMPDGPSGQNNIIEQKLKLNGNLFNGNKKKGKLRKFSSPAFLKSTFSSSKSNSSNSSNNGGNIIGSVAGGAGENFNKKNLPSTESTGWEWYRLKKFNTPEIKMEHQNNTNTAATSVSSIPQKQPEKNRNLLKPEIILRINGNGTVGSCGSVGSSTSKNSDTEFLILNSSNCSESDSLITSNSEEISTKRNGGPSGDSTASTINNGSSNNLNNKRNSKKQRSFKKMFKKVF